MKSQCRRGFRPAFFCALILLALAPGGRGAPIRSAPEYSVKAAYLLLFARYVTWPEAAFPSDSAPLVVGIAGRDPFGKVLPETFQDSRIHGRPLEIRRMPDTADSLPCHMIFIGAGESARMGRWLERMRGRPVLAVTESEGALERGSTVNFLMEGNRLRFEVSLVAAEAVGLKIASPMLVSARKVHKRDEP